MLENRLYQYGRRRFACQQAVTLGYNHKRLGGASVQLTKGVYLLRSFFTRRIPCVERHCTYQS